MLGVSVCRFNIYQACRAASRVAGVPIAPVMVVGGGSGEGAVVFKLSIPLFYSVAVVFVGTEAEDVSFCEYQISRAARKRRRRV